VKEHTFLGSVCFYSLGQSISNALKSIPETSTEEQCHVILESGLIEVGPPTDLTLPTPVPIRQRSLPRGFSRGLSFDLRASQPQLSISDSMKKGFLDDLLKIRSSSIKSVAGNFCRFVYEKVNESGPISKSKKNLDVERFVIGALLKQTGYISAALRMAMNLNDPEKPEPQPTKVLTDIWNGVYSHIKNLITIEKPYSVIARHLFRAFLEAGFRVPTVGRAWNLFSLSLMICSWFGQDLREIARPGFQITQILSEASSAFEYPKVTFETPLSHVQTFWTGQSNL
jgi:hypothetical protein